VRDITFSMLTGQCITIGGGGIANLNINNGEDPIVAIHVNAPCNCPTGDCSISTQPPVTGLQC